jgi:hypothetical protein
MEADPYSGASDNNPLEEVLLLTPWQMNKRLDITVYSAQSARRNFLNSGQRDR